MLFGQCIFCLILDQQGRKTTIDTQLGDFFSITKLQKSYEKVSKIIFLYKYDIYPWKESERLYFHLSLIITQMVYTKLWWEIMT